MIAYIIGAEIQWHLELQDYVNASRIIIKKIKAQTVRQIDQMVRHSAAVVVAV